MPDEQRIVTQRANYLARSTDLRQNEAEAIAWTERGYSWNAVGRKLDTSGSTAKGWTERAMAQYGLSIAETLMPEELEPPLSEPAYESVDVEYIDELQNETDRKRWAECIERNVGKLPQPTVNEVVPELERRGYLSID
ncbi:hypothetical protein [Halosolutus gelatinilyticus]|uniref:hypothetical protein n=1 Tax=Halosolutus gelatinilyticus TaxID=2931975 RepID=UPI001FF59935|nr:hypothetical protein [Halosolutus gelatinilyticus]